jgi:hypothetical protein
MHNFYQDIVSMTSEFARAPGVEEVEEVDLAAPAPASAPAVMPAPAP